jgi:membrane protein YdbS with pleckstrin-like domain
MSQITLHQDEVILVDVTPSPLWTCGAYVVTLGLWEAWRRRHRYIVTNQRVLATKGIITKSQQSAPLGKLQDVHTRLSPLQGSSIVLSTAGGALGIESVRNLTRANARAFTEALNGQSNRATGNVVHATLGA